MAIRRLHTSLGRIFTQRCFYLFASLVALIGVAPWVTETTRGRIVINVVQVIVLIAAIAAVGRTVMPFLIGLLLGMPALGFQVMALLLEQDAARQVALSTAFYLAFYVMVVVYLLRYVFSPEVMTDDKLFGAAAGYMMLGILWAAAYRLVQYFEPQAFGIRPGEVERSFYDLLYMSFGCLTSNGPGGLVPTGSKVRSLVILEQVSGTLFVAILIARLAGIYPPKRESGAQ